MEECPPYERFPWAIVLLANIVTLLIYAVGTYLLWGLGLWWAVLYVLYCGWNDPMASPRRGLRRMLYA